jgi:hypothetical protein
MVKTTDRTRRPSYPAGKEELVFEESDCGIDRVSVSLEGMFLQGKDASYSLTIVCD